MHKDKQIIDKIHDFLGFELGDTPTNPTIQDILDMLSTSEITLDVGVGQDFTTLNEALSFVISLPVKPIEVIINLVASYEMNEQVWVEDVDLSYVEIQGGTVFVNPKGLLKCITVDASPEFTIAPAFYGKNSVFPNLNAKFELGSLPFGDSCNECVEGGKYSSGILLDNSSLFIAPDNGFTDFTYMGLVAINGSNVVAHHCSFDDNGNRASLNNTSASQPWWGDGVRTWTSTFSGSYATASRCGDMGFHFSQSSKGYINKASAIDCGHHAILCTTGSSCSARQGFFTDTIDDNVVAYAGSTIDLRDSDCSRSKVNYGVIATRSSTINFERGVANNCGYSGIMANRTSLIDATDCTSNNSVVDGVRCANGSTLDVTNATILNSGQDGLHCTHGSIIQFRESTIGNSGRNGVLVFSAMVYGNGATITGSGKNGVEATRGSIASLDYSNVRDSVGKGLLAYSSDISANFSNIMGSGGRPIEATQGGSVKANSCNITGSTEFALSVYSGGRIFAANSNGSANRDVNELTQHGFIIR